MGSVAAMLVGAFVKAPAYIHIPLCIIAALAAGALWGGLVGFLKIRFGAQKEIGGTVYTVTGSYDGVETLDRKMERIMGEKFTEKMEDSE